MNKFLAKISTSIENLYGAREKQAADNSLHDRFKPDFTPEEMKRLGVLRHPGSAYNTEEDNDPKKNFFGVSASLPSWPEKWHHSDHPRGWFEWMQGYAAGKRTPDDERQIKRWLSFKARHLAQLQKADPTLEDDSIQPKRRQSLLNWGIAAGDKNRYLAKIHSGLEKEAKKAEAYKEDTRPHVLAAHKRLEENGGLIVNWLPGSGKTKFFLDAAKTALDKDKTRDALIVAPASLVTNIDKELDKHGIKLDRKRLQVLSYEKAHGMADELSTKEYSIAIADEAHKLRNADSKRSKSLTNVFSNANKRVLSTGTSNYNSVADIAPLVNIAAGGKVLPTEKAVFEKHFVKDVPQPRSLLQVVRGEQPQTVQAIKNGALLKKIFERHTHYYDPASDPAAAKKYPKVTEEIIKTEMSPDQAKVYKFVEGNMPFWMRVKIRNNLPLDKKERQQFNAFSQDARQVSNSYRPYVQDADQAEYTPKIRRAVEELVKHKDRDKNFRGLVYSNYLGAGLEEYSKLLTEQGVKHGLYTGSLSKKEKDHLRDEYNAGRLPALLVSASGAEGLDLKGSKLCQILESHYNKARLTQVIGRTARYESHEHLPEEERHVKVQRFHSTHPKNMFGSSPMSIDEYLHANSEDKQVLFDQIKSIMKDAS